MVALSNQRRHQAERHIHGVERDYGAGRHCESDDWPAFGSGATSPVIPHGKQADQFKYYAKWGMTAAQALQTAYLPAAQMLNYGWENQIGSIEKGKFADIIAVSGNPLTDVTEMERVKFVMKGGMVVRNDSIPEK